MTTRTPANDFLQAADAFVALCDRISKDQWSLRGLGEWTLRDLVGHTLRAVTTVPAYLEAPSPETVACSSPGQYFAMVRTVAGADDAAVAARGRQSGLELGDEPSTRVREAVVRARKALEVVSDSDRVVSTVVGGMRLGDYLPTRTFELTAHSLDIAVAAELPFSPAPAPLQSTLYTTVDALVHTGDAVPILRHLLGRPEAAMRPLFGSS